MFPLIGTARALSASEAATGCLWAVAIRSHAEQNKPDTPRWLFHPGDDAIAAGLAPGEIVLWVAAVTGSQAKETPDELPLEDAAASLSSDEIDRLRRFVHDDDRRSYAAAHGGARMLLGRVLQQPPEALRFSTSAHGKPILSFPSSALDFSISHARGVVAVAAAETPIGVDVEPLRELDGMEGMLDLVLSPQEQTSFQRTPEAFRSKLFLRYWTLKEALLKAAGLGFTIAPNLITIDVGPVPALISAPRELGNPAQWQLMAAD